MNCLIYKGPDFGTKLPLSDDSYARVDFTEGFKFEFYNIYYSTIYVGSNGYITFNNGDTAFFPTFLRFIDYYPRIAPIWDDFNPSTKGGVYVKQLPDRFVITWLDVPEFGSRNNNTFQIVLYSTGLIGFGYNQIDSNGGLVGVSEGNGGRSAIFRYAPPANYDPEQTVEGPKGQLDYTQLFWLFNGCNYELISKTVPFCSTFVVPKGYVIDSSRSPEVAVDGDAKCITCYFEPILIQASIPSPFDCKNLICLVKANVIRCAGSIGYRGAIPIKSVCNDTKSYVCSSDDVCFNNAFGLTCDEDSCACGNSACLRSASVQSISVIGPIAETCDGDLIYELTGLIKLVPCC